VFPDFKKETSEGPIASFHAWKGDSWAMFCSHPADFTPVCTTELGELAKRMPQFTERNCKIIALSVNDTESHAGWITDIKDHSGCPGVFPYPIIADTDRSLMHSLGMIDDAEVDAAGNPMTCRAVFIVGPDHKLKLSVLYPASCGRNFDELIRVLDSLQMTVKHKVATPVNWKKGDECMVVPGVKTEDIPALFPKGHRIAKMPSGKGYMRFTPDPSV